MRTAKSVFQGLGLMAMMITLFMGCPGPNPPQPDPDPRPNPTAEHELKLFTFPSLGVAGTINQDLKTVDVRLPFGTSVTNLVSVFAASEGAVVTVGGTVQQSGVTANDFTNDLVYKVTAQDGGFSEYTVDVTVAAENASSNSNLSSLEVLGVALDRVFDKTILSYAATVPYSVEKVKVRAVTEDAKALLGVNGKALASGVASGDLSLVVGSNILIVVVTAEDASQKAYTITLTRSAEALHKMESFGFPAFNVAGQIDENLGSVGVEVPFGTNLSALVPSFTVSPGASVTVNGATQTSGSTSQNFSSPVVYRVTGSDGLFKDYTVTVTVASQNASGDSTLAQLSVSGYALSPAFSPVVKSYSVTVPNGVTSVSLTAGTNHPQAKLFIKEVLLGANSGTVTLPLVEGENLISLRVQAENGTSTTYALSVIREGGAGVIIDNDLDPITITFSGLASQLSLGKTMVVSALTSEPVTAYSWKLYKGNNSTPVQTGASASLTVGQGLAVGDYTLSVVVLSATKAASASANFTVINGNTDGSVDIIVDGSGLAVLTVDLSANKLTVTQGGTITLSASPSANPDFYKWYIQGVAQSGASGATFTTPGTLAVGKYKIDVVITKGSKVASDAVIIEVLAADVQTVATPTLSVPAGEVAAGTQVVLSTATAGATLKYTTDGSDPKTSATVQTGSTVTINAALTIRAYGVKSGMLDSAEVTAAYTLKSQDTVATPVFSVSSGAVVSGTQVTLSSSTSGATIKYTTDGTDPKTSGTAVIGTSFTVTEAKTYKAYAFKAGLTDSAVATESYTLKVGGSIIVHTQVSAGKGFIHFWNVVASPAIPNSSWTASPAMTDGDGDGWYDYTFTGASSATFLFKDVTGNTTNKTADLSRTSAGEFWYLNGTWYDTKPEVTTGIKIHVPVSEGKGYIHYWNVVASPAIPNSNWAASPAMTDTDNDGWYDFTFLGATSASFLFKAAAGDSTNKTGDLSRTAAGEYWYKAGTWYTSAPAL